MKFLIDQNRSPRMAALLRESGHDAVHTLELALERAEDDELLLLVACCLLRPRAVSSCGARPTSEASSRC